MANGNQGNYPGEGHYYSPDPNTGQPTTQNSGSGYQAGELPGQPPKRRNIWKFVAMLMTIVAIIFAATTVLAYNHIINPPVSAGVATSVAQHPTSVPVNGTPTSVSTALTPTTVANTSSTPTSQPAATASNYSALQPGPGCDTNGGTWTPQGLSDITCGTNISPSSANTRGYLFLQLPNNKAFSSNNKIGVIGNPSTPNGYLECIGLDEQNANTGFLVEYCGDGHWSIYSISSDGTIVQTLAKNLTSTRATVDISLAIQGTTLSFSTDNEMHTVNNITPIQPTKVAITYLANTTFYAMTINNFSYTLLSS